MTQEGPLQMRRYGGLLAITLLISAAACDEGAASPDVTAQVDAAAADRGPGADVQAGEDLAPDDPPRFIAGPELLPGPCALAPLAAVVEFSTDRPVAATLEIRSGESGRRVTFVDQGTSFSLPVLGLIAGEEFTVEVVIRAGPLQTRTAEPLTSTAPSLPAGFPPLETTLSEPALMEPGVILFNPFLARAGTRTGYAVAVDQAGRVVWFYEHSEENKNVTRRLANGNLIMMGPAYILEVDMLGNILHSWSIASVVDPAPRNTPVSVVTFHHDLLELPSGNLLFLSREQRTYQDYPTSATDPLAPVAPSQVAGDLVVEMARDGTIVRSWALLDLLDPYRFSYSSLNLQGWPAVWPGVKLRDWSHANGLAYDEGEDTIIVSIRHQDALIKIKRQSGELLWILGPHDNWNAPWAEHLLSPEGTLQWPYHAHAPQITAQGTIMLFDNGNFRASPFDAPLPLADAHSRAVELSVDGQAMEVSQVWSYGDPLNEQFYSSSVSSAYRLPLTGNILVTQGNLATDSTGKPGRGETALFWARIVEVTHTTPAEKVFELELKDDTVLGPSNWRIYRGQKLPSLYPPQLAQEEPLP